LDWVFEQTSEAIILEDDCVPHPSFFRFCTELLEKYRDDERIMTIGGTNYQFGRNRTPHSYYFSIYPHIWGWATWKRAWRYYDNDMQLWPRAREEKYLDKLLTSKKAVGYWRKCFDRVYNGKIDSWAYVWTYSSWMNNGLTILPSGNLVSNIGVGMQATHTVGKRNPYLFMPQNAIEFPLMHPPEVVRNITADEFTQNTVYRTRLLAPIKHEIKKLLVSLGFME
jgi:hypothetical protein